MKRYLFIALLLVAGIASATSWQKADLQYIQTINGKNYTAEVTLLKPESYFINQSATKSGNKLNVDLSEMGLGTVTMDIVKLSPYKGIAIKDSMGRINYKQIDEINWNNDTKRPVVATYKTWSTIVKTYTFKNTKTGAITKINATPGHPFYVVNKRDYIPIEKITPSDRLINQFGKQVELLCPGYKQTKACGVRYNKDNQSIKVYNFEVYDKHRYYASGHDKPQNSILLLVHNKGCGINGEDVITLDPITPDSTNVVRLVTNDATRNASIVEPALYYRSTVEKYISSRGGRNLISPTTRNEIIGIVEVNNRNWEKFSGVNDLNANLVRGMVGQLSVRDLQITTRWQQLTENSERVVREFNGLVQRGAAVIEDQNLREFLQRLLNNMNEDHQNLIQEIERHRINNP